jgi:hypothetical protein
VKPYYAIAGVVVAGFVAYVVLVPYLNNRVLRTNLRGITTQFHPDINRYINRPPQGGT